MKRSLLFSLFCVLSIFMIFNLCLASEKDGGESDADTIEGAEITVVYMSGGYADAARDVAVKFKSQFDVDVTVVDYPWSGLHEKLLTEAYKKKFPDVDLRLPKKSLVPTISEILEKDARLKELFEVGMEAEQKAEDFYKDLAGKTRDSNSKSMLEYLASMEHSHYSILEAEYRQLEMGEDYNSDDYLRGDRLMNLGP